MKPNTDSDTALKTLVSGAIIVIIITTTMAMYHAYNNAELYKVKSNKSILVCAIASGEVDTVVASDLVVDRIDGRWIFVNGSASRCKTLSNNKLL